ncbi:MAG: hypothetical protein ABI743_05855, partial [bacterium]
LGPMLPAKSTHLSRMALADSGWCGLLGTSFAPNGNLLGASFAHASPLPLNSAADWSISPMPDGVSNFYQSAFTGTRPAVVYANRNGRLDLALANGPVPTGPSDWNAVYYPALGGGKSLLVQGNTIVTGGYDTWLVSQTLQSRDVGVLRSDSLSPASEADWHFAKLTSEYQDIDCTVGCEYTHTYPFSTLAVGNRSITFAYEQITTVFGSEKTFSAYWSPTDW